MGFHRLTVPTYFGGLPGGYDYINNALAGTPAVADGPKVGGPNAGTYFVAWTDDGTSPNTNRPVKALAQNTDVLDDLLHRDLAIPKVTVDVVAGGAVSSIVLTDAAGVFVGVPGTPNTATGINTFVEVVDSNDNEIIGDPTTGARSRVTAISATVGTHFATPGAVTLTISPAIPTGTTYRVYYAGRGNLATIPEDGLSFIKVRAAQEQDGKTIDFTNQITRRAGIDVQALVASILETPNGVRRPKSSALSFDVDPDGSNGGVHRFDFRMSRDVGGVDQIASIFRDPSDTTGLVRRMQIGASGLNGFGSAGTLGFFDAQTIANGSGGQKHIPFSSATATDGDSYLRVSEKLRYQSILKTLNARYYSSIGDGTTSFGDFNGSGAVAAAIAAFGSTGVLFLRLKAGSHVVAGGTGITIPSGLTVVIEGEGGPAGGFSELRTSTSDKTLFTVQGSLVLRQLTINSNVNLAKIEMTGTSSLKVYNCFVNKHQVHGTNIGADTLFSPVSVDNGKPFVIEMYDTRLNLSGIAADPTGASSNIQIDVDDTQTHFGFLFRNCVIQACPHNSPFKVKMGASASQTRLQNVFFEGCRIFLGSTTVTSDRYVGNSGAFWCEPSGTNGELEVDNIVWKDCVVIAAQPGGTGTEPLLLQLVAEALDFDAGAHQGETAIGRVAIFNSRWLCPDTMSGRTAFALRATTIDIDGLEVRASAAGWGSITANLTAAGDTAANFGNVHIEAQLNSGTMDPAYGTLNVRNVLLWNVPLQPTATDGVGDLHLVAPSDGGGLVDGVVVQATGATPDSVPSSRIRCSWSTGARFNNIMWMAPAVGPAAPIASLGILTVNGGIEGYFDSCVLRPPVSSTTLDAQSGAGVAGFYIEAASQVTLNSCSTQQCLPVVLPDANTALGSLSIIGGQFFDGGFRLTPTNPFFFMLRNAFVQNTAHEGLVIKAPTGVWTSQTSLNITGNFFQACGDAVSPGLSTYIEDTTGGINEVHGVFLNNTCVKASGAASNSEFKTTNPAMFADSQTQANFFGTYSNLATIGAAPVAVTFKYVDGAKMMMNFTTLKNG